MPSGTRAPSAVNVGCLSDSATGSFRGLDASTCTEGVGAALPPHALRPSCPKSWPSCWGTAAAAAAVLAASARRPDG
eukprot:2881743-Alexandrium_andersonii.AAC.1